MKDSEKKNSLVDEYKQIIVDSLYDKNLIDAGLYEKCSKPEYIQSLPHDLRTTDSVKLTERKNKIEEEINTRKDELDELTKTNKEKGEQLKKDYDKFVSSIDDFFLALPYKYDVEDEDKEWYGELYDNLSEYRHEAKDFKSELNKYVKSLGVEDMSSDFEKVLWKFKDIESKYFDYDILDYYKYTPNINVGDSVDGIFRHMNSILENLRYEFKENGLKIKELTDEIDNLDQELVKVDAKLS